MKILLCKFLKWCWASLPRRVVSSIVIVSVLFSPIWYFVLKPTPAEAVTFYDSQNGNWDVGTTWGGECTESCVEGTDYPGSSDLVVIDSNSVSTNGSRTIAGLTMSGSGLLSVDSAGGGDTFTINGDYSQDGGTFDGNSGTVDVNGDFSQTNGTFTSTSNELQISQNMTVSGGTFNANGGTVKFDGSYAGNTSIDASGVTFNLIAIDRSISTTSKTLTIAEGTTVPLGDSPTVDLFNSSDVNFYNIDNQGTITVGSGTLTTNIEGNFTNNGIVDADSITSWTSNGNLINNATMSMANATTFDFNNYSYSTGSVTSNSGASFTTGASPTFTVAGSFIIASDSTFPTPDSMTFDGTYAGWYGSVSFSIDAPDFTFPTGTVFDRTVSGATVTVTIYENTTIPLGDSPTVNLYNSHGSYGYNLTNNGTITVGTGTLTSTIEGNFTNGGIVDADSITSWTNNGSLINNATMNMGNATSFDFNNYGNSAGSITNNSGAYFSAGASPTFTVAGSFIIASDSTFPTPGSITFDGSYVGATSIDASGITFPAPVIFDRSINSSTASLTIYEGTTIPLGDSPSLTLYNSLTDYYYHLTNNGTITTSGTSAITTSISGNFTNNGIVDADSITSWTSNGSLVNNATMNMDNATTFDFNNYYKGAGSLTNNSGAYFSAGASPDFNVVGSFVIDSNSTFPSTLGSLTLDGPGSSISLDASAVDLNLVTINKSTIFNWSRTITIYEGTTVPLGDSPTINFSNDFQDNNLVNNGIITVGTGTFTENVDGTFSNNGTVKTKTTTLSGSIANAADSTVEFWGNLDGSSDTYTLTDFGTAYHHIKINSDNQDKFELGEAITINGTLTIQEGALDINGNDLDVTGGGEEIIVEDGGKLQLRGSENINANPGNPQLQNGSTVVYNASSGGPYDIKDYAYHSLLIAGSGTTFNMVNDIDTGGDIRISSGTLDATESNYNINLEGDWNNTGTFNAQQGTVTFDGCNQEITGTNTFYNLAKTTTSSCTWTFPASTTTTVEGTWTAQGQDGDNLLSLRSSVNDTQWEIDPQGTRNITYSDVKDSNNVNATQIDATGGTNVDSLNNDNWAFLQSELENIPFPLKIKSSVLRIKGGMVKIKN